MRYFASLTLLLWAGLGIAAADDKPGPDGWIDLLAGKPEDTWRTVDANWIRSDAVTLDPEKPNRLKAKPVENGKVWVNGVNGRVKDLITKQTYGDCEVQIEFLIAKGSNSGIKFHALYEIQIFDSYGKDKVTGKEMGGIYPRAQNNPYKYLDDGIGAKVNACRKPGEWQTLTAKFQAAKFNDKGEKTKNAVMVRAELNGQLIHENVELKHPTGSNWVRKESPKGPFMLQADHGPVSVRLMKLKAN